MELAPTRQNREMVKAEDVKESLAKTHLELVGDLSVLSTNDWLTFFGRRVLYVEHRNAPQIPVLTDSQVDALNAAGYYKRFPTPELAAIPLQFAAEYNALLQGLKAATGIPFRIDPFRLLVSRLDTHLNYLGSMSVQGILGQSAVEIKTTTNIYVRDESMAQQAMRIAEPPFKKHTHNIGGFISVHLFPPGMGRVIFEYDKGYYIDGDVAEWKDVIYKNRYVDRETINFLQLQEIARGEHPYPEIVHLDKSIFETMTEEEARLEMRRRGVTMGSMRWTLRNFFSDYSGGDFDETSYDPSLKREGDPQENHTHYGRETVWES